MQAPDLSDTSFRVLENEWIALADGTRRTEQIVDAIQQSVQNGTLVMVDRSGKPQPQQPDAATVRYTVENSMVELSRMGFWSL